MDYNRRPYTASVGPSTSVNDRVSFNLNRAESLLDEPDTGFSIRGNLANSGVGNFGMGSGIGNTMGRPQTGGIGGGQNTGNFNAAARSNYTGSDMGDSDTQSIIQQTRPKWGNQPTAGVGGGLGGITEIGTIDVVSGGRRANRFAGGNQSNQSGRVPTAGTSSKLFPAAANTGSGYYDILENEMSKPTLSRGRSTNLLSDAGSKYGGEDDEMSHYMGQSALGGASIVGKEDVSSNVGGYNRAQHASAGADNTMGVRSSGSRRQQVLERNKLAGGGSTQDEDSRRGVPQPSMQKAPSQNYGLFLGGGNVPPRPARSKTEEAGARNLGEQGNTIVSNDSATAGAPKISVAIGGLVRERSFPPNRATTFGINTPAEMTNIDSRSIDSKNMISPIQNSTNNPNISIHDNKREYLKEKKRRDLEALEAELRKEKERLNKLEEQFQNEIDSLREKQNDELARVEAGHKETLEMLSKEKDKITGTLYETLEKEHNKMDQLHKQDLINRDKQHAENLASLKVQLQKETQNLEAQVSQQNELREILEGVQRRTVDITEIVESSLRQREDELKRKEMQLAKEERQMIEDEVIKIEIEEKKLAEEERKLQLTKDMLLKLKQTHNQEINRMREQRQNAIAINVQDEQRLRFEERLAKENLSIAKKRLEQENEKRSAQNRLIEVELSNKESEVINANQLFEKEKKELETEQRENYIREIQVKQIEMEDRKKLLSNAEHELRRQKRMLEKKRELIEADRQQLEESEINFETEKIEFEALAEKIQEIGERLQSEREIVLEEKAGFDFEKEQLDKIKHDLDIERSLLQAEFLRAEELEHELIHRENMLKMLLYNKEHKEKQRDAGGLLPPYTSCPNLKMENVQGHNLTALSPGGEFYDRNPHNFSPQQTQYAYGHQQDLQAPYQYQVQPSYFNYNSYIQDLQRKLGDYTLFQNRVPDGHQRQGSFGSSYVGGGEVNQGNQYSNQDGMEMQSQFSPNQPFSPIHNQRNIQITGDFGDPRSGFLSSVTKSGRGFREKILAQLGNAQLDDSKFNSNSEQDYDVTASLGTYNPLQSHGVKLHDQRMSVSGLEDF